MSPGTDFNMYQKVTSNTKSNVPISHATAIVPSQSFIEWFLLGETEDAAKQMPKKNLNKFFTAGIKSPRAGVRLAQYVENRNKLCLSTGSELR
jgi:hypothetical protein